MEAVGVMQAPRRAVPHRLDRAPAADFRADGRAAAADLAAGDRAEEADGTADPAAAREAAVAGHASTERVTAEGIAKELAAMGLAIARTEAGVGRADTRAAALSDSIRLRAGWKESIGRGRRDFARRSAGSSELGTQDLNAMAISRVAMVERKRWLRAT